MATISAVIHHPYRTIYWEYALNSAPSVWADISTWTNIYTSGQGTTAIELDETKITTADAAKVRFRTANPAGNATTGPVDGTNVVQSEESSVAVGQMTWLKPLSTEAVTLKAYAAPKWATIPDEPVGWGDSPRVIEDLNVYCSGGQPITFNATNGTISGNRWTAPEHGVAPGAVTTQITATNDEGSSTCEAFTTTVTGTNPTVTVPNSGEQPEGGSYTFVGSVIQPDGGLIAAYTWSWGDISNVSGQGTNSLTISPLLYADNGKSVTLEAESYEVGSGYKEQDIGYLTVKEAGGPVHSGPVYFGATTVEFGGVNITWNA